MMIKRTLTGRKRENERRTPGTAASANVGAARKAYGEDVTICINAACQLRKKAGGCLGFEGCPGFKAR